MAQWIKASVALPETGIHRTHVRVFITATTQAPKDLRLSTDLCRHPHAHGIHSRKTHM